jgi:type II secretory pathway pseudopilin PulG
MKINACPSSKAFTIAELLIATAIILLTSLAILFSYVQCLELNTINKNTLTVLENARNMMETIKSTSFDQIYETYHKKTFPLKGLDEGIGLVEIDNKNPQLLGISVKCFWKTKNRITGEDKNLDGILDQDEDTNNNGTLDSPVSLFTTIAKR